MPRLALFAAVVGAALVAAQSAPAAPTSTRFDFTGTEQTFTVPAGVTTVHVVAIGGKGGTGAGNTREGGFGAIVNADLAVTPGEVLSVIVGGNGDDATGTAGGAGGFNNGGAGGSDNLTTGFGDEGGGGGGGMSDVVSSEGFLNGALVVGAGGGGSGGGTGSGAGGGGADADGKNGQAGGDGDPTSAAPGGMPGGGGGTTTAPGASGGGNGSAGHLGGGGVGADGFGAIGAAAAGGGGAGRWGGGGGDAGDSHDLTAGGGGAGSSTSSSTRATNTSYRRDTTGVPSITFTYDLPSKPGGGGGGGGSALAPALKSLKLSPRTFIAASRGGSIGGKGTTISYRSAAAGITTFTVLAPRRGLTAARCVKPKRGRRGKRCTRYVSLGSFKHVDVAGFNKFVFTGRVRHHRLKRGRYRLQAVSRANGKKSKAVTASFRIAS